MWRETIKNHYLKTLLIPLIACTVLFCPAKAQDAAGIIKKVREKLDKVKDYEATGKMKMNVNFIKAPVSDVKVYYKKPDKLKIKNEKGISLVPKGSINISIGHIITSSGDFDIIDAGKEDKTGLRVIKLLPRDENTDVVLSTLYVDSGQALIKKARTTTRNNGTYELEFTYGKYAGYGLADKVVFSFNTKEYKLPKGVSFDYDDGNRKGKNDNQPKDQKGTVEIDYSVYIINKGVPDSVFE